MSSILNSVSKFNSPILTIMVFIFYFIVKMELQSSAFNKRKIFGDYLPRMSNLEYWLFISMIIIDIVFLMVVTSICMSNQLWVLGIILLGIVVFFVMLLYSMLAYPHLYKKDKYPTYYKNDKNSKNNGKYIILDIFKNKAQVARLNNNAKNKQFSGLKMNNKRYIVNINKIINNYGVYYINDKRNHKYSFIYVLLLIVSFMASLGFLVISFINWACYAAWAMLILLVIALIIWLIIRYKSKE